MERRGRRFGNYQEVTETVVSCQDSGIHRVRDLLLQSLPLHIDKCESLKDSPHILNSGVRKCSLCTGRGREPPLHPQAPHSLSESREAHGSRSPQFTRRAAPGQGWEGKVKPLHLLLDGEGPGPVQ